jgi:hypothetical protein
MMQTQKITSCTKNLNTILPNHDVVIEKIGPKKFEKIIPKINMNES